MYKDIATALWFFLPAGCANMAPILAMKLPVIRKWDTPIDFGRTMNGRPILGPHKTWRGVLAGIVLGTLVLYAQIMLFKNISRIRMVVDIADYSRLPVLVLGPLFAIGALGGDAAKSFFKRRRGTPSGQTWIPFDQIDYIAGAILATFPIVQLNILIYIWAFVCWVGIHLLSAFIGYKLGFKDQPI